MLDLVDEALTILAEASGSKVQADEIAGLWEVAAELADYRSTYGPIAGVFGVAPHPLGSYTTFHGPFRVPDARYVAQRIRSFLRSQDQAFRNPQLPLDQPHAAPPPDRTPVPEAPRNPSRRPNGATCIRTHSTSCPVRDWRH